MQQMASFANTTKPTLSNVWPDRQTIDRNHVCEEWNAETGPLQRD
jgi:hypothetical protein